jgi:hypothetical protein
MEQYEKKHETPTPKNIGAKVPDTCLKCPGVYSIAASTVFLYGTDSPRRRM